MAAPPVIHPADRLSRLPDEVQAHILSFLPAQEAVRTCVLARTWRNIWKLTRRLRITGGTVEEVEFVNHLLRLRLNGLNCAPLDECEIKLRMVGGDDTVNRWIHTSLVCQVQVLRVLDESCYLMVRNVFLVSQHLTRLELRGAWLYHRCLNLHDCPALEHLEIRSCVFLDVRKIMSPSLKRLVITECNFSGDRRLFKITAPCLVSLRLEVGAFRAPILESMPELVEAYVRIGIDMHGVNCCSCDHPLGCYHVMRPSYISAIDSDSDNEEETEDDEEDTEDDEEDTEDDRGLDTKGCVLLEGLAQAKHLVLLAHHFTYIFRRDLRMCPTFSNLKALVLNGYWCQPADCRPLACILEHAPVLENLTVVFSEKVELKYDIVLEGHLDVTAESTMTTQYLKTVKIKCDTVDEGVNSVLKFLSTLNICFNLE